MGQAFNGRFTLLYVKLKSFSNQLCRQLPNFSKKKWSMDLERRHTESTADVFHPKERRHDDGRWIVLHFAGRDEAIECRQMELKRWLARSIECGSWPRHRAPGRMP
jgi:hypothetical protein